MTKLMTQTDASRIQSAQAKKGDKVETSFSSRAIKAAVRNASGKTPPPNGPSKTGEPSGGGRGNNPPSKR